jgi:hypothetical protein
MKLTVRQLPVEDIYKDLVRIPEIHRQDSESATILEGTICKLSVSGGKSKLVSVRGCGASEEPKILMDDRTRKELHVDDRREYEFELRPTTWWGHSRWAWSASDPAYRIPARLCVVSVALGAIGLALGLLSFIGAK